MSVGMLFMILKGKKKTILFGKIMRGGKANACRKKI